MDLIQAKKVIGKIWKNEEGIRWHRTRDVSVLLMEIDQSIYPEEDRGPTWTGDISYLVTLLSPENDRTGAEQIYWDFRIKDDIISHSQGRHSSGKMEVLATGDTALDTLVSVIEDSISIPHKARMAIVLEGILEHEAREDNKGTYHT